MFQFLMVRLKVYESIAKIYCKINVSIPYGTIKSGITPTTKTNENTVSIPYGTIKSVARLWER